MIKTYNAATNEWPRTDHSKWPEQLHGQNELIPNSRSAMPSLVTGGKRNSALAVFSFINGRFPNPHRLILITWPNEARSWSHASKTNRPNDRANKTSTIALSGRLVWAILSLSSPHRPTLVRSQRATGFGSCTWRQEKEWERWTRWNWIVGRDCLNNWYKKS